MWCLPWQMHLYVRSFKREKKEKITLGSQRERMRLGYCRDEITRRVYERSDGNTVQKLSSWNKVHLKADWMHPEAVGSSHLQSQISLHVGSLLAERFGQTIRFKWAHMPIAKLDIYISSQLSLFQHHKSSVCPRIDYNPSCITEL